MRYIVTLAVLVAFSTSANAQAKCKNSLIPFEVGASWTFEKENSAVMEKIRELPAAQLLESRIAKQASKVTLTVEKIEEKAGVPTVFLKETAEDVSKTVEIGCTSSGLIVPIQSILYSAEPAAGHTYAFENAKSKGSSYALRKGNIKSKQWSSTFSADVVRGSLPRAKLSLERTVTVGRAENLTVMGKDLKPKKFVITIKGTATIEGLEKMPVQTTDKTAIKPSPTHDANSAIWFAPDYGPIKFLNSLGHEYLLTDFKAPTTN